MCVCYIKNLNICTYTIAHFEIDKYLSLKSPLIINKCKIGAKVLHLYSTILKILYLLR